MSGWTGHLLQDECRELSRWLANKLGAMHIVKNNYEAYLVMRWAFLLDKPNTNMHAYAVFFGTRQTKIYATSLLEAKEKGIAFFRAHKSREHLVTAYLVELNGQTKPINQVIT